MLAALGFACVALAARFVALARACLLWTGLLTAALLALALVAFASASFVRFAWTWNNWMRRHFHARFWRWWLRHALRGRARFSDVCGRNKHDQNAERHNGNQSRVEHFSCLDCVSEAIRDLQTNTQKKKVFTRSLACGFNARRKKKLDCRRKALRQQTTKNTKKDRRVTHSQNKTV